MGKRKQTVIFLDRSCPVSVSWTNPECTEKKCKGLHSITLKFKLKSNTDKTFNAVWSSCGLLLCPRMFLVWDCLVWTLCSFLKAFNLCKSFALHSCSFIRVLLCYLFTSFGWVSFFASTFFPLLNKTFYSILLFLILRDSVNLQTFHTLDKM